MQEGARGRENREKGAGDRGPQAEKQKYSHNASEDAHCC